MNKQQSGFTLIELVVVIVILGILAATALPKFVDLSGEAEQAAVQGVAGAVSSAAAINYAKGKASGAAAPVLITNATDACTEATNSLIAGYTNLLAGSGGTGVVLQTTDPATTNQYKVAASGSAACSANATVLCTLTSKSGKTATAALPCTN